MGCPAKIPQLFDPPRTPPPADVINAMAVSMVHDLDDVIKGLDPYVKGRALPDGVTQESLIVSFAMSVYGCLTHASAFDEDGNNPFPAKLGDVLLGANPKVLKPHWRRTRAAIAELLESDDWPLLDERKNFRSRSVARFVNSVLDLMWETRARYLLEAAQWTSKMTPEHRAAIAKMPMEADQLALIASMPESERAAVVAAVATGKNVEQAIDSIRTLH